MKTTRLLVLTLVLALSAAIVAGCGSSSGSGGDDDPAALIPAGAPLYVEGVVRPDGKVRSDLEGALKKILRTDDPGAKIQQLIDDSGKSDDITFKDDVEPWVGDRVGFAITALHNGRDADYAAVIDSKDDGKAEKLLAKQKGTVKRSYKGTDYRFDAKEKTATALIDHRVVVATEGGLKAVIDAKGKDHLDQANGLTAVRSKVAQDRIGLFYLDVQGFVRTIAQQASSDPQVGALVQSVASAAPKTLGAALQAQPDALRVDAVSIGTPQSSTPAAAARTSSRRSPATRGWGWASPTWVRRSTAWSRRWPAAAASPASASTRCWSSSRSRRRWTCARTCSAGWAMPASSSAGPRAPTSAGRSSSRRPTPAKTKRTMAVLERYARQSAGTKVSALHGQGIDDGFTAQDPTGPAVHVALAGDRFVVAVGGKDVLAQAVSPASSSARRRRFTAAAGKLGNGLRPSFYLDFTQVTKLIESFAGTNAGFQKAKPYLDTFGAVVAGAKSEGSGVTRSRFVVTLR